MVTFAFFAGECAAQFAQNLLQELAEQLLTGLLLFGAQAGPQLGLARVQERETWLAGCRSVSGQLHENLLSHESLQQ
jgi:hypothetical protein